MKIIVQKYNVGVSGPGLFTVKTDNEEECIIPTFGYDENGHVKTRKKAKVDGGYCPPKQEWIDEQIKQCVDGFVKNYNREVVLGQSPAFDVSIETTNKEVPEVVYVFLFSRSDFPNEIGICTSSTPFIVEDSAVKFNKECEYVL